MAKAYRPAYHPRPNAPGFWLDAYLTNYGCQVVLGPDGLVALGWAAEPTPVDTLRPISKYAEKFPVGSPDEGRETSVVHSGGWYGPLPVPMHRRYEIRKLRNEFHRLQNGEEL